MKHEAIDVPEQHSIDKVLFDDSIDVSLYDLFSYKGCYIVA